ncbi:MULTISPECIES: hypothetical protein [unclassified Xanthomonas]|uniref:hypothetical protein n=1 Tax=unclassified Xanthomonas TaxID=2643310 RepID=UPI002B23C9ED|nr:MULTISPECIES: hypothetical protein [unclassified Xanthomonas]MEA9564538.1 hypothetical protein [Xanthomonas sp. WHRI 8932A]MEA9635930.1 hypothetical protein [Xanthomonas sp. WHRI 8812E]
MRYVIDSAMFAVDHDSVVRKHLVRAATDGAYQHTHLAGQKSRKSRDLPSHKLRQSVITALCADGETRMLRAAVANYRSALPSISYSQLVAAICARARRLR